MFRGSYVATVALLAASCAQSPAHERWTRSGTTPMQVAQDLKECQYEAEKSPGHYNTGTNIGSALGDGISEGIRGLRLTSMCMDVRGYKAK